MARGWQYTKLSLSSTLLRVAGVLRVGAMHHHHNSFYILWFPARLYILPVFSGICFRLVLLFSVLFCFLSLFFFNTSVGAL